MMTSSWPIPPVPELSRCLAKTIRGSDGRDLPGVDVLTHCLIVGEVARELIRRQPEWLRNQIFPSGSELVAAAHDVGKISPTFQKKLASALGATLLGFDNINPDLEENWGYHGGVSQAAAKGVGPYIPEILGRHHGSSPFLGQYNAQSEVFGGESWQKRREELLATLQTIQGSTWPTVVDENHASVLAGLVTVADWVGSGPIFGESAKQWRDLVPEALDRAGFLQPRVRPRLSFQDVFERDPRPAQSLLFEACRGPGVYILEAPMGIGKTEAALYAAYKALDSNRATGIYFALPTQLTSNKMHERVNIFLERILENDQPHRKSLLVHGSAKLFVDFETGEEGCPGRSWFSSNKRGLLAPFAVGTIDQALMAVMNVRHGFVRSFGLAGKIVILDEVHSYDSYTGTILDALVKCLVDLHCTVIILSATLTRERRGILLGGITSQADGYPLVCAKPREDCMETLEMRSQEEVEVELRLISEDELATNEALARAEAGQQILWVENTVAEAQERYKTIGARAKDCGVDCGLLHSRFTKADRQTNEGRWVDLFGLEGKQTRASCGRILVGTQVLEQSLDIDADFIVTRLCPTDMLLQRMGRLWRHENERPRGARREIWILAPRYEDAIADPEGTLGRSAFVYSPYVLCRTLEVWKDRHTVQIPGEIRSILEATYEERTEADVLAQLKYKLERKREDLRGLALLGVARDGKTQPESAATRYSDGETVEVLLLSTYTKREDSTKVTFTDGHELFLPTRPWSKGQQEWRQAAIALALHTVVVSPSAAPPLLSAKELAWLKEYIYLEYGLRVALVQDDGSVVPLIAGSDSQSATYDPEIGYQPHREEKRWKS